MLQQRPLYNPTGKDKLSEKKLLGYDCSNLINLQNVKYTWAYNLYEQMRYNIWTPQLVNLTTDKTNFKSLTKEEQTAYKYIISSLSFLDSIQVSFLPKLANFIFPPEIIIALIEQTSQEVLHNASYRYLIETIIPENEQEEVLYLFRNNSELENRNNNIQKFYSNLFDNPSNLNLFKALFLDYLLEGICFYNSFNFFYNLAIPTRTCMDGTATMISYIHRRCCGFLRKLKLKNIPNSVKLFS